MEALWICSYIELSLTNGIRKSFDPVAEEEAACDTQQNMKTNLFMNNGA